jgi:putative endonuclease
MYYVYLLISIRDGKFYTGFTEDLEKRLAEHNEGTSKSTSHRRPLELIYYEACRNRKDALHREKYLKTTYGKHYLRNRLKNDLAKEASN